MFSTIKKISVLILLLSLVFVCNNNYVNAAVYIPEKVRIGLFFDYESKNIYTAVAEFNVNAVKGLQFGFENSGKFTALYEQPASGTVIIRKDSYFIKNGITVTEYNPKQATLPSGEKIGPYHVQIGGAYTSLDLANTQIKNLKQKGIDAYPAYVNSWQVWTGFYTDANSAQLDISNSIAKKLGSGVYKVVQPSTSRISVLSANGTILFLYGSSTQIFHIHPRQDNNPYMLNVNGKAYRGDIEVRRFQDSDLTVINVLPLEQYLYGVVPCEIQASAHPEALKAQAVAARTYILKNINKYSVLSFNLCSSTLSQVYKGFSSEKPTTNKAVDDTKGKKVLYNGQLAYVYYFSSSGGRTEDNKNVWGYDYPYLRSVEDKYESGNSWKYNWETTHTASDIKKSLLSRGYDLGDIISITINRTSETGRATELEIKGTKDSVIFKNSACRSALDSLGSQWYTISTDSEIVLKNGEASIVETQLGGKKVMTADGLKTIKTVGNNVTVMGAGKVKKLVPAVPTYYKITGRGWGHAIGMSQEGAKGMANAGLKYDEILRHYFKGVIVQ